MQHRDVLKSDITDASLLRGNFTLRSGAVSNIYWDKYRFECHPLLLREIACHMTFLLPDNFTYVAGLETGGIPIATAIMLNITQMPMLIIRKEAKAYGTCNLIEGEFEPGLTAVVIEDVITSGGQVCKSVEEMRNHNLKVENVVCVIDRCAGGRERIESMGCNLKSLFELDADTNTLR